MDNLTNRKSNDTSYNDIWKFSDDELRKAIIAKYKDSEVIKIVNQKQCMFYMEKGVYPLYIKNGYNDKIVFVFLRETTLKLFNEWREQWKSLKEV